MIFLELADGSFIHLEGCYRLSIQNYEKIVLTVCQSSYGWKELDLTGYYEYDDEHSSDKHGRIREDLKTDLNKLIDCLSVLHVGQLLTIPNREDEAENKKAIQAMAECYQLHRSVWMKPALLEGEVT